MTEHIANFAKNLRQYEESLQTLDDEMRGLNVNEEIEDKLNNLITQWETDNIYSQIKNIESMIRQLKKDNNGTHEDIAKRNRAWALQALETQVRNEDKRAREVEWGLMFKEYLCHELKNSSMESGAGGGCDGGQKQKVKKCRKNKKRKLGGTQRNLYL